ncbi:MAG: hypothetical protein HETSPECPRED_006468 [Heterodermia speciosa]|uniref:Uncharacterized protein n=1 Tax=Heterodermia speciosa TaxID=116794 RepID=A0A8H3FLW3_9LECA|nr:MAG: hypothetical protein HETSPECPRED_006468 [Heterodermia speciosa]
MPPPGVYSHDLEPTQFYQERHRTSNLPIQQPFQHPSQIANEPIVQQYAQASQQPVPQQSKILEQFNRKIQQLQQHYVQDAPLIGQYVPQSPQTQLLSFHYIYHPPLPRSLSQTMPSKIQSQAVPTTPTTAIQAHPNTPQVRHPPGQRTSKQDQQTNNAPRSATFPPAADGSNVKDRTEDARTYFTLEQLVTKIMAIFLQHVGQYITLHDIPISMANLDDFSHRYTAHTFQLLNAVAAHPPPQRKPRRPRIIVLSDQGYESIDLSNNTTIILFVRSQPRPNGHWVVVQADRLKATLTYHDPMSNTADAHDQWLTQTCNEVQTLLQKAARHQYPDRIAPLLRIIRAQSTSSQNSEDSGPLAWQELELQTRRCKNPTLAKSARRRQIARIYHALRGCGKATKASSPPPTLAHEKRIIEVDAAETEPEKAEASSPD